MKSGSRLEKVLTGGGFAVTAEMGPPKSADVNVIKKKADLLQHCVDAVNITDNQTAIARMSSLATCALLMRDYGVEPVMQLTCRDRNRIAMQSDIIGGYALGIRNLLCLSGDHQTFGNHPGAKNVYDIDSIQLVNAVRRMRDDKVFMNGEEIRNSKKAPVAEPRLFIGAAANPFGDPFEYRPYRLAKKIAAGADFIQTQAIFDVPRFEAYMAKVRELGLHEKTHILAGVMPVRSHRALEFMRDNVPGMVIPQDAVDRMKAYGDKESRRSEGVALCAETIERLRNIEGVAGIHIMAVEWEAVVPELVEKTKLK